MQLRYLRNEISHEYETDSLILIEKLNKMFSSVPELLEIYDKIKKFLETRKIL